MSTPPVRADAAACADRDRPETPITPEDVPGVQEIERRLCHLIGEVADEVFGNSAATDCFCGEGGFWPLRHASDWRHDPESAVAFIERATRAAIEGWRAAKPDPMTWSP